MDKIRFPLQAKMKGEVVAELQEGLQLLVQNKALTGDATDLKRLQQLLQSEQKENTYGEGTMKLVELFQKQQGLRPNQIVDELTAKYLNDTLEKLQPRDTVVTYEVSGRVVSGIKAGLGGLIIHVVDQSVGQELVLATTTTNDSGTYHVHFDNTALTKRGKAHPDLQVRVYSGDSLLQSSAVLYNATIKEHIHVFLDEEVQRAHFSEHDTIVHSLKEHHQGRLADLQEIEERQDITYLAHKTGWDARAVAMVSLADQLEHKNGIDREWFYALLRAGLPAKEDVLFRIDSETIEKTLRQAIAQGVIAAELQQQIPKAVDAFREKAAQHILARDSSFGVSSLKDILSVSIGDDERDHLRFSSIYTAYRHDETQLWQSIRESFGEKVEKRLKLDGQLAYLTMNNAPLIRQLHSQSPQREMTELNQLIEAGYYEAERWLPIIVGDQIPADIPGEDAQEKRLHYAKLLAAQIKISYPTAVVSHMVKQGVTPLKQPSLRAQVYEFLEEHRERFELGVQPIEQYAQQKKLTIAPNIMSEISRIQRVFQITPNDEAMNALLMKGIDSAHAVSRYTQDEFIQAFEADLGGKHEAQQIHYRAQQVHQTVLSIVMSYMTSQRLPQIGAQAQSLSIDPATPDANTSDVIAYSALEGLFGGLDYCACEHCRSILSPAAYMVDLLQFIDRPTHPIGYENPQKVLLERRPDLQHLPLSCENTNVSMPYIDLVNETLEYYVAHRLSLDGYRGHNTEADVSQEELLASSQYVMEQAYQILAGERPDPSHARPILPPVSPLPFHQPLERMRRYCNTFPTPLVKAMQLLRRNDELERAEASEYGWRDINMEQLGISRQEHELLTDGSLTLQQLYGYQSHVSEAEILEQLSYIKALTRRLSITYEEMSRLLQTRFINNSSSLIAKLEPLGVSFRVIQQLKEGVISDADFEALLSPHLDRSPYGGDVKEWLVNDENYRKIMGIITLTPSDPEAGVSDIDHLVLRYTDPNKAATHIHPHVFIRLFRFIRLWQKLDWTIEQTDEALTALLPQSYWLEDETAANDLNKLDQGFLTLLPRLAMIKRVSEQLNLKVAQDLSSLLSCFTPMNTDGSSSLYAQLFLRPSSLRHDVFADDGYGQFLQGDDPLYAHAEMLRGAFRLTHEELSALTTALGFDEHTKLTLDNVTHIFRYSWLAKKLQYRVQELMMLVKMTGIDPFETFDPIHPPLEQFLAFTSKLASVGMKPADALYLIWDHSVVGRQAPHESDMLRFARELRADYTAIARDFHFADDPNGQVIQNKLTLIYGNEAAHYFVGLMNDQVSTDVAYAHHQETLSAEIHQVARGAIRYDALRKRLIFSHGVMTDTMRDALLNIDGMTVAFREAIVALYEKTRRFFQQYPELHPLYDRYVSSDEPLEEKQANLLAALLPDLQQRREQEHTIQAMASKLDSEQEFIDVMLNDATVLHAFGDAARPALDDVMIVNKYGLDAYFYYQNTATGSADVSLVAEASLNELSEENPWPQKPDGTAVEVVSAIWEGYLEVPESGFYNFRLATNEGAQITLHLDGQQILTNVGAAWHNQLPLELQAGMLYSFRLKAEGLKERLTVQLASSGKVWNTIPTKYLYSAVMVKQLSAVYSRCQKSAAIAAALGLTGAEWTYFASHADYMINGESWLNYLPVTGGQDTVPSSRLYAVLSAMMDVVVMSAQLDVETAQLLQVFQDPVAATARGDSLLYELTGWEPSAVKAMLGRIGKTVHDLVHLDVFIRVYEGCQLAKNVGIGMQELIDVVTNDPQADAVRVLHGALRARYDEAEWLKVLQKINDDMRGLQRDALVAYILHMMQQTPASAHINTPEKLFEYFLMDVKMAPCMQTSRIRFALSSIQLFIDRCLLNLEPRVSPTSILAKQWEWMNRYRVWEANRKIFLYPENWLEPELRDDQSPFFQETMSELLQSDITEEAAASALVNYLSKLEEVAKLEPCGIYYDEQDVNKTEDDVAHVIARTAGANRKYYYRRQAYGAWTPWEEMKLDIEDNPIIPVVWKGRLFAFWLRILKDAPLMSPTLPSQNLAEADPSALIDTKAAKMHIKAILCWSEFYHGKWQQVKTSDVDAPAELGLFDMSGENAFARSRVRLSSSIQNDVLLIHIGGQGYATFYVYNTHSTPEASKVLFAYTFYPPSRALSIEDKQLQANYRKGWSVIMEPEPPLIRPILNNKTGGGQFVAPAHQQHDAWGAPFFYEDKRHVFYVTTKERIVKVKDWSKFIPDHVYQDTVLVDIPPLIHIDAKQSVIDSLDPHIQTDPKVLVVNPLDPLVRQPEDHQLLLEEIIKSPFNGHLLISEDAFINQSLITNGSVMFNHQIIGPTGSQIKRQG